MTNENPMKLSVMTKRTWYWAATAFAGLAVTAVGVADVVRAPAVTDGLTHLGYPAYFATIVGVWKLLGVAAIVTPGHERVKEWAYAGLFFVLTGAAMSHAITGDPIGKLLVPVVVLAFVMASWMLQPKGETSGAVLTARHAA